jgi:hypothetical protein
LDNAIRVTLLAALQNLPNTLVRSFILLVQCTSALTLGPALNLYRILDSPPIHFLFISGEPESNPTQTHKNQIHLQRGTYES